jgi:hypothetical protein
MIKYLKIWASIVCIDKQEAATLPFYLIFGSPFLWSWVHTDIIKQTQAELISFCYVWLAGRVSNLEPELKQKKQTNKRS